MNIRELKVEEVRKNRENRVASEFSQATEGAENVKRPRPCQFPLHHSSLASVTNIV